MRETPIYSCMKLRLRGGKRKETKKLAADNQDEDKGLKH
jgi:hypothetical protein